MFSMHMLPQNAKRRREMYKQVLGQGCSMHCVFENLVIASQEDVERIEELLQFSEIADKSPRQLSLKG